MIRTLLLAGAASLALGAAASAEPIVARDGRFEATVAATQMSRLSIEGEKIAAVRKVEDPEGPAFMVEPEPATGDVYVAFDGDVVGRSFTAFLVTESGKTVQALLRPTPGEGRTVLVRLAGLSAPASSPPSAPPSGGAEGPRAERTPAYTEAIAALMRLMFNGEAPAGVERVSVRPSRRKAGPFELVDTEAWSVMNLRGRIITVTNRSEAEQALSGDALLVHGVLAVGLAHERLAPGESARVLVVEEAL
ncbi:MAG TPA: type-F conjugative transfer system secretin TraK [Caulobacteraceae bacterium]|nr:type-F conjugative transfer system secretin TraK [Caulobacteraceae bacterium]